MWLDIVYSPMGCRASFSVTDVYSPMDCCASANSPMDVMCTAWQMFCLLVQATFVLFMVQATFVLFIGPGDVCSVYGPGDVCSVYGPGNVCL